MQAERGFMYAHATGEVSIGEQMWLQFPKRVSDPPYHPVMEGALDIANQMMESPIANRRQFREAACQLGYGAEQVQPRHPRAIEDLH